MPRLGGAVVLTAVAYLLRKICFALRHPTVTAGSTEGNLLQNISGVSQWTSTNSSTFWLTRNSVIDNMTLETSVYFLFEALGCLCEWLDVVVAGDWM